MQVNSSTCYRFIMGYEQRKTIEALDRTSEESLQLPYNPRSDKYVIFSDLHKADKVRGIDDFQRNETIFAHALEQYYNEDYRLVLNGDIEECWEAKPREIINSYKNTIFALERQFAEKGQEYYIRIFGNHDDLWRFPEKVQKHLWPVLGRVNVFPGLKLGDDILITHGHQGDPTGDTYSYISRYFVRTSWRWLQRFTRITNSRASKNHLIRQRRDEYLYSWAKQRKQLLIAGHTHNPMFQSYSTESQLEEALDKLSELFPSGNMPYWIQANIDKMRDTARHPIRWWKRKSQMNDKPLPCYFNGGAGVHFDGVTGIELENRQIRMVKWELSDCTADAYIPALGTHPLFKVERKVLQSAHLDEVIAEIKGHSKVPAKENIPDLTRYLLPQPGAIPGFGSSTSFRMPNRASFTSSMKS